MTLCSKIPKTIHTSLEKLSGVWIILEPSVNYFGNFGAWCYLLKIGCNEFSFTKHREYQCNLSKELLISKFVFLFPDQSSTSWTKQIIFLLREQNKDFDIESITYHRTKNQSKSQQSMMLESPFLPFLKLHKWNYVIRCQSYLTKLFFFLTYILPT